MSQPTPSPRNAFEVLMARKNSPAVKVKSGAKSPGGRPWSAGQQTGAAASRASPSHASAVATGEFQRNPQLYLPASVEAGAAHGDAATKGAAGGPAGEDSAEGVVQYPATDNAVGAQGASGRNDGTGEPPAKRPRLQDLFARPTAKTFSRQVHDLFLVLDLEATCTKRRDLFPVEIIELSCVLLDAHSLEARGEFQAYVRPTEHPLLDPFCVELTGIEQAQVDTAAPLGEVLERLDGWLRGRGALPARPDCSLLPVTWTDWDLKVCLETECEWRKLPRPPYLRRWCNLKRLFTQRYKRTSNLRACVESLGLEWRGRAHSGLDDSRNTAALAARMARDGAVLRVTDSFREQLPQAQQAQQQAQQQGQGEMQGQQAQQGQGQQAQQGQGQQGQGQQGQGQGQQGQQEQGQGQQGQGQQGQGQQEQGQGATKGESAGAGSGDAGEGPVERGGAAAAACAGCGSPTRGDGGAVGLLENPHGTRGGTTRGAGGAAGGAAGGTGAGAMGGGGVRVASSYGGKNGTAGGGGGGGKGAAGLRQTVLSLTPRKQPPQPQHPGAESDGGSPAAGGATAAAASGGTEPGPAGGGGSGVAVAASLAAVLPSAATAPPLYDTAGRWLGRCRCGVAARARTVKKPGANLGRHFYSCGRWSLTDRSRQCDFFAFADSLQLAPGAAPAGGGGGAGRTGGGRR